MEHMQVAGSCWGQEPGLSRGGGFFGDVSCGVGAPAPGEGQDVVSQPLSLRELGAGCAPAAGEPCWPAGWGRAVRSWGLPCPLLGREERALLSLPMPFVPSANAVCPLLLGGAAGDSPIPAASRVPGGCGRRCAAGSGAGLAASLSSLPPCLPCPVLLCPPRPLSVPFFSVLPPHPPRRSARSRRCAAPHRSLLAAGTRAGGAAGRPFWGLPLPCRTAGTPPQPHRAGAAPRRLPAAARAPGRPGELPWHRVTGLGVARRRLGPSPAPTAGSWAWGWRGGCCWRSRGAEPLGTGSPRKGCGWCWGHLAAPRSRTTARG